MAGWPIGQLRESTHSERRFVTAMGIAPDIDGAAIFIPPLFEELHRTFGHNLFFGALVPLSAFVFFERKRAKRILPLSYVALFSHYLLDLFVTGWWAFYPFWPVGDTTILMSLYIPQRIMMYHLQISLGIVLFAACAVVYLRKGRTPLEVLSPSFDELILTFITLPFTERCSQCANRAFYRCVDCGRGVCGRHSRFAGGFSKICQECSTEGGAHIRSGNTPG